MRTKIIQRMCLVSLALLMVSGALAPVGEGAEISIYNSPPTFVTFKILDLGERIQVILEISDMNGWEDIWKIYVNVTDIEGNIIESALYQQYMANTSTNRVDLFSELRGNSLIPAESEVERFPFSGVGAGGFGKDWFNATYQRMTFIFYPFSGYYIYVEAFDRKLNKCEYSGPFSSAYEEPPLIENPMVPLGLSLVIASATGAGIYVHRRHSNKLAQLAEQRVGG